MFNIRVGIARMAELVDALASGASVRKDMEVRVFFRAPAFALAGFGWLTPVRQPKPVRAKAALRSFCVAKAKEGLLMYYVYLLRSTSFPDQTYRGFTEDLKTRFKDHNAGKSKHTSKYAP